LQSSSPARSPLSTRGPDSSMWSRGPRPLPPPPISAHQSPSWTAQLVEQILHILPRIQSTWPVVYVSVGGDRAPVKSHYLSGSATVPAEPENQTSAMPWSRGMDRSRYMGGSAPSSHTRNNSQPAYGHGPTSSRPGLSHRRAATEGRHAYADTVQQHQPQRLGYLVHVDEKTFAEVCGQTLTEVISR